MLLAHPDVDVNLQADNVCSFEIQGFIYVKTYKCLLLTEWKLNSADCSVNAGPYRDSQATACCTRHSS